jgi:hypothetical protein
MQYYILIPITVCTIATLAASIAILVLGVQSYGVGYVVGGAMGVAHSGVVAIALIAVAAVAIQGSIAQDIAQANKSSA